MSESEIEFLQTAYNELEIERNLLQARCAFLEGALQSILLYVQQEPKLPDNPLHKSRLSPGERIKELARYGLTGETLMTKDEEWFRAVLSDTRDEEGE